MHPRRDRGRMKDNRAATAPRRRIRAASPDEAWIIAQVRNWQQGEGLRREPPSDLHPHECSDIAYRVKARGLSASTQLCALREMRRREPEFGQRAALLQPIVLISRARPFARCAARPDRRPARH
jgi:hypothetical protein